MGTVRLDSERLEEEIRPRCRRCSSINRFGNDWQGLVAPLQESCIDAGLNRKSRHMSNQVRGPCLAIASFRKSFDEETPALGPCSVYAGAAWPTEAR